MSCDFRAGDALLWSGGSLLRGEASRSFCGVSIDSRAVGPGELFVAIRGPNHDAHHFLSQAVDRGAAGLLVEKGCSLDPSWQPDAVILAADDTTAALGALAAGHRRRFGGPVIAITGSNGKTTTKEMCAAILSRVAPCLKSQGNLNNEFGLPLSLLRRRPEHRSAVVELGMNHRGEIARLAAIARPSVGVITNVGSAHIEYLGSREEIAREKGDLLAALESDGVAVVNRDDPLASAQAERSPARVLGFGSRSPAEVSASAIRFLDEGAYAFELETPEGRAAARVAGLSETAVANALAAAAASFAAGASLDQVVEGLASHRPPAGRMAPLALGGGITLIDDSYNANPQSLRVALESLVRCRGSGRALAVLGDMGELGARAEEAHREAGRWVAELGIDFLFALGELSPLVAEGAAAFGMEASRIRADREHQALSRAVRAVLCAGDWVLVKGSRAMKMEGVVEALASEEGA
jgi:UDP-N-acetylmuramoyl-tripeptide--D-alanyl-D-alanine ligase